MPLFSPNFGFDNWALYAAISASLLIMSATIAFLWSLLNARRKWWLASMSLLLLGVGCLLIALNTMSYSYERSFFENGYLLSLYNLALYTEISAGALIVLATIT
ncbi:MAG: hypothetical protein ABI234_08075, partial [Ktedonobacteraceae bacterium]